MNMIHGRDLRRAAINWCLASGCTLIVIWAMLLFHLYLRLPLMVPL
jgi:hypothetical protein